MPTKAGSSDIAVQKTNDDSVVSKRSAGRIGYCDDQFLRHFVRKTARRTPLINRGYYLRIAAMTEIVTSHLRHMLRGADSVQVMSLGAGFDTLAARSYCDPALRGVQYYEVDFPDVIANKAGLVKEAGGDAFPFGANTIIKNGCVHSDRYHALGCDLRTCHTTLLPLLQKWGFEASKPTVVYSECVMQYMPPEGSDEVVEWVVRNLPGAVFAAYDQINPNDSFGGVMTKALKSKASPLLGTTTRYPGMSELVHRAKRLGLRDVRFANFFDLSAHHFHPAETARMDKIEAFDEREEWSEMCDHYGILVGATGSNDTEAAALVIPHPSLKTEEQHLEAQASTRNMEGMKKTTREAAATVKWPTRFPLEGWGHAVASRGDDIVSFGGYTSGKGLARSNDVRMYHFDVSAANCGEVAVSLAAGNTAPRPRVFAQLVPLGNSSFLLFGGRGSPRAPMSDAWLLTLEQRPSQQGVPTARARWTPLVLAESSPQPCSRYRHVMCGVGERSAVLHGGCDASGTILSDTWRCEVDVHASSIRWVELPEANLPALASAAVCRIEGSDQVAIFGGLTTPTQASSLLAVIDGNGKVHTQTTLGITPRFSHTLSWLPREQKLLVVGGSRDAPKQRATDDVVLFGVDGDDVAQIDAPEDFPRPLSRHGAAVLSSGDIALVGGGYTCFSFGNFTPKNTILRLRETPGNLSGPVPDFAAVAPGSSSLKVTAMTFDELDDVSKLFAERHPVVVHNAPLGACTTKWADAEYLAAHQGDTRVAVHVSSSRRLDFVQKNFEFHHVKFAELARHCFGPREAGDTEQWYFRSVGSNMRTQRADFWRDFSGIAGDFSLPPGIDSIVKPRIHQSCLRLNRGGVNVWTHYDVMDNVLCQVVGTKRVVLFPPSQHGNLYMHGSSSRVIGLDKASVDLKRFPKFEEALRHRIEVVLTPGDILHIPALWFHGIESLESSASVNVFYRHLEEEHYDPMDLYGNKDLPAAVAMRQQVVEAAKEGIEGVDAEKRAYYSFALRQAAAKLEELAASLD